MSNINQREDARKASMAKLSEVAALGETLNIWKIERKSNFENGDMWRFCNVVTPDNLHFCLHAGSWNKENKISICVDCIKIDDKVKAYVSDVKKYDEAEPDKAYISADKPAATILKDMQRRVINNPVHIDFAKRINARIEYPQASQNSLSAHVATLEKLGFTFYAKDAKQTYSTDGHKSKFDRVSVNCNGFVTFGMSLPVSKMAALLDIIEG